MNFLDLSLLYVTVIILFPVPASESSAPFRSKISGPPVATNIIYQSKDNGNTWQDISYGLPLNELPQDFFVAKSEIYLRLGASTYYSKNDISSPVWEKERDRNPQMSSIALKNSAMRAQNVVESNGIVIATGQRGIRRSTDNGEHWEWVIREGGVGIAVEKIDGGLAAISCNTTTMSRRIHVSMDDGMTWKAISDGLRPTLFITSIKQVGKYLICGHPDGIFRSSDMGKTWDMVHPSVENRDVKFRTTSNSDPFEDHRKVFKIHVSGNTVYAVAGSAGC